MNTTTTAPDLIKDALEDALSVCSSVSMDRNRRVMSLGCPMYLQTEEWCLWLEKEVGPRIEAALAEHLSASPVAAGERKPVFWYRPRSDGMYEGPIHDAVIENVLKVSGAWVPLFAASPDPAPSQQETHSAALLDVIAERKRQISVEGWNSKHDDQHRDGGMALAAACYACNAATWAQRPPTIPELDYAKFSAPGFRWPWAKKWWKPKSQRQDLIRAAALVLAEIERLDRAYQAGLLAGKKES